MKVCGPVEMTTENLHKFDLWPETDVAWEPITEIEKKNWS